MDRDTYMRDVASYNAAPPARNSTASLVPGKDSTQIMHPQLDTAAIQTKINLRKNQNIPLRHLHPVTPSAHGPFGSQAYDARSGAPMSLSHPGYNQEVVQAITLRHLERYNSAFEWGPQSHVSDFSGVPLPANPLPKPQRILPTATPAEPEISNFEAFMKEIERSSSTQPLETATQSTSSQSSASVTRLVPYTDPMRHSSDNPPPHGGQRAVLRRDTAIDPGNVISPTFMIAMPFGDVLEVANHYPSEAEMARRRRERS